MTAATPTLGARALALFFAKHDAPEIAVILTAEFAGSARRISADEARELYQTEFRNQRRQWA